MMSHDYDPVLSAEYNAQLLDMDADELEAWYQEIVRNPSEPPTRDELEAQCAADRLYEQYLAAHPDAPPRTWAEIQEIMANEHASR